MASDQELKEIVKKKYSEIAQQSKKQNETSCCGGTSCCTTTDFSIMAEASFGFLSKKSLKPSQAIVSTADLASTLPSFALVWPSN